MKRGVWLAAGCAAVLGALRIGAGGWILIAALTTACTAAALAFVAQRSDRAVIPSLLAAAVVAEGVLPGLPASSAWLVWCLGAVTAVGVLAAMAPPRPQAQQGVAEHRLSATAPFALLLSGLLVLAIAGGWLSRRLGPDTVSRGWDWAGGSYAVLLGALPVLALLATGLLLTVAIRGGRA